MTRGLLLAALMLPLAGAADAASCGDEVGMQEARKLVDQCLQVSPATHPPCNAGNACSLMEMEDEIARGCQMLGDDRPDFCGDYD